MASIKFRVEGMTCGHCKASVEKALKQLSGVSSAAVDLQTREAVVEYDAAKVTAAVLKETVEDIGYDVAGI